MPAGATISPIWRGALVFCVLLGAFAAGFLVLGDWGGWYYDGTSSQTRYQYNYDRDAYDPEQSRSGSESWESDGLFTEATLALPFTLALCGLLGAAVILARLAFRPTARIGRSLLLAGSLAAVAALSLGIEAIMYAGSMSDVDDWWFGSAFYAGLINSTLLAVIAFALLRARAVWPTVGSAAPPA